MIDGLVLVDYAQFKIALLGAYEKEPRLLTTVDQIAQRMRPRASVSPVSSHA